MAILSTHKFELSKNKFKDHIKRFAVSTNSQKLLRLGHRPIYRFYWFARFLKWASDVKPLTAGKVDLNREALYGETIHQLKLRDSKALFMEFGVFKGESFRLWVSSLKNTESTFWGFDTFTGLPESWGSVPMGFFSTSGRIPTIDDPRAKFFKGTFQKTLPRLLQDIQEKYDGYRKILHMDADLYGSTLFVLMAMAPLLKRGDLIIFDEFCFVTHEFRAFVNFLESWPIKLNFLRTTNGFLQVAFEVD